MKKILYIIFGIFIGISLVANATNYNSSEITYNNSISGSTKTNVKEAVDELYNIANKRVNIRVASNKRCIRAINLHTQRSKTFGSLGTSGTLASGDAFDCDVNNDGIYDGTTERFYYVTDLSSNTNKAVLIYYSNTNAGVADPTKDIAYNSANVNNLGPVTAIADLPSTSQWVTTVTNPRQITNQDGGTTTPDGTIVSYNYEDRAARLLTGQELMIACGITTSNWNNKSALDTCTYLIENTRSAVDTSLPYGYWLETPYASYQGYVYSVHGGIGNYINYVSYVGANQLWYGVRPAIEVPKSDISY